MLFKRNNHILGQSILEYSILIALVLSSVLAMVVFARRGLQAQIYDAQHHMIDMVHEGAVIGGLVNANTITGYGGYEPYYTVQETYVSRYLNSRSRLDPVGGGKEVATKIYGDSTSATMVSNQLAPKYAE